VGQDEIRLRQNNLAEETQRTIPGAAPSSSAQVNNGNVGASFVNLRSLGTNRNIVLLDGVRIVPFDQLLRVDLNNIPLALVDRVDVLTGGASSTYGADAVAGVINFITRNDFSGMELSISDRLTQRGDGNFLRGDMTIGGNFDDGRGNAVISVGYQESDPVFQGGDRAGSQLALDSNTPANLALAGSSVTTPTAFDTSIGRLQVGPTGDTLVPFYQSFNFNPYNVFQTPFQRYNLFSAGHYDITDHLTVYARGLFSQNSVKTIIAPSGSFGSTFDIPLSNPFMSNAQANALCQTIDLDPLPPTRDADGNIIDPHILRPTAAACAAHIAATDPNDPNFQNVTVGVRRRTVEVGPRLSDFQTRTWDFRTGIRGDITDKIGFDVFGARGTTNSVQNITGYARTSHIRQALLATDTATCLDPSQGCVPLNLFGPPGTITPEMADFIEGTSTITTNVKLSQARGTINGDTPLQLWGKNPVSFALGAEYRKYSSDIFPDELAQSGDLGGFGAAPAPVKGGLDAYEGFAEVIAPIISDRPFFEELQLEAGIRRSHYTIAAPSDPKFNTTTWKVAGSWAPVRDIKFRGAYNRAVRAPNIAELFAPVITGLTNLAIDPCAGLAPTTNPALAAVCLAQGAPASQIGSILNPNAGQANLTVGGNLNLKPEKATTWTLGAVVRPRFLPGLSATIDYYNIKVKNAITVPTPDDLVTACFGNITSASATDPACTNIRRNTLTGALDGDPVEVPGLLGVTTNAGTLSTDGIDLTLEYRHPLGTIMDSPAKLALSFGGNYTHSQKFQATPTSINRECVGLYSANCGFPAGQLLPKFTFNERTTLSLGRVDLSLLWRYIHKMRYEFAGDPDLQLSTDPDYNHIPSQHYFDFTTRFNVNEHFDLTFSVLNLFDNSPPLVGNTAGSTSANSGNTFPATYDPLGRRFAAGARIKF
jgi:iron complex outermembrane recepter protein